MAFMTAGPSFRENAFAHVDALLESMLDMGKNHPLGGLLGECVLFARELLCCWDDKGCVDRLHTGGLLSMILRLSRMQALLQTLTNGAPIVPQGQLEWNKRGDAEFLDAKQCKWRKLSPVFTRLNAMGYTELGFVDTKNTLVYWLDLSEVEFVTCRPNNVFILHLKKVPELRTWAFRALDNDSGVRFRNLFEGAMKANRATEVLNLQSETDMLKTYSKVQRPVGVTGAAPKDVEFLVVCKDHLEEKVKADAMKVDTNWEKLTLNGRRGLLEVFDLTSGEGGRTFPYQFEINIPSKRTLARAADQEQQGSFWRKQPHVVVRRMGGKKVHKFTARDLLHISANEPKLEVTVGFVDVEERAKLGANQEVYYCRRFTLPDAERCKRFHTLLLWFTNGQVAGPLPLYTGPFLEHMVVIDELCMAHPNHSKQPTSSQPPARPGRKATEVFGGLSRQGNASFLADADSPRPSSVERPGTPNGSQSPVAAKSNASILDLGSGAGFRQRQRKQSLINTIMPVTRKMLGLQDESLIPTGTDSSDNEQGDEAEPGARGLLGTELACTLISLRMPALEEYKNGSAGATFPPFYTSDLPSAATFDDLLAMALKPIVVTLAGSDGSSGPRFRNSIVSQDPRVGYEDLLQRRSVLQRIILLHHKTLCAAQGKGKEGAAAPRAAADGYDEAFEESGMSAPSSPGRGTRMAARGRPRGGKVAATVLGLTSTAAAAPHRPPLAGRAGTVTIRGRRRSAQSYAQPTKSSLRRATARPGEFLLHAAARSASPAPSRRYSSETVPVKHSGHLGNDRRDIPATEAIVCVALENFTPQVEDIGVLSYNKGMLLVIIDQGEDWWTGHRLGQEPPVFGRISSHALRPLRDDEYSVVMEAFELEHEEQVRSLESESGKPVPRPPTKSKTTSGVVLTVPGPVGGGGRRRMLSMSRSSAIESDILVDSPTSMEIRDRSESMGSSGSLDESATMATRRANKEEKERERARKQQEKEYAHLDERGVPLLLRHLQQKYLFGNLEIRAAVLEMLNEWVVLKFTDIAAATDQGELDMFLTGEMLAKVKQAITEMKQAPEVSRAAANSSSASGSPAARAEAEHSLSKDSESETPLGGSVSSVHQHLLPPTTAAPLSPWGIPALPSAANVALLPGSDATSARTSASILADGKRQPGASPSRRLDDNASVTSDTSATSGARQEKDDKKDDMPPMTVNPLRTALAAGEVSLSILTAHVDRPLLDEDVMTPRRATTHTALQNVLCELLVWAIRREADVQRIASLQSRALESNLLNVGLISDISNAEVTEKEFEAIVKVQAAVALWTEKHPDTGPLTREDNPATITRLSPRLVAEQLTVLDVQDFLAIHPREFVKKPWTKKETAPLEAPHVLAMIASFEKRARWASTEIVLRPTLSKRVACLRMIIVTAWHTFQLGNYFSTFALFVGVSHSTVLRLKKTWARLSPKVMRKYEELEHALSGKRNTAMYRQAFRRRLHPLDEEEGAREHEELNICKAGVPHMALVIKDFFAFEEKETMQFDEESGQYMVQLKKLADHWKLLREILICQTLLRDQGWADKRVVKTFKDDMEGGLVGLLDEDKLWESSYICEPKEVPK